LVEDQEMIDIVFINPSNSVSLYQGLATKLAAVEPPTWALLLAESVRSQGYSTKIVDANAEGISDDELVKRVSEYSPRLICLVVYGQNVNAGTAGMSGASRVAKALKASNNKLPVTLIGSYVQALPIKTLEDEMEIDIGFTNEGVYALWNLLKLREFSSESLKEIKGIVYRADGDVILNKAEEVVPTERMDHDLPGYAWDLLPFRDKPLDLYRAPFWHAEYDQDKRSPYAAIQSSLGCNFGCAFCMINIINRNDEDEIGVASNYSRMRFWSPEFMIKQFDLLAEMGVRTIRIVDEMFLLNRKYYVPLCEMLAKKPYASELRMWAYSRVDTIANPEFLQLVRSAGIKWLCLGIESAERSVRLEISKGKFQDVDIKKVVNHVHDADIEVMANFIVGLPGENHELMQRTLDLSIDLCTSGWNMYAAMALPGSALYKQALEKGYELPDSYAGFSFHSYETLPMPTEFLTPAEVLEFRDKAFVTYHSNPQFLKRVAEKFGDKAVENINEMLRITLKRKIIEEKSSK
jgi:anaerobic magnesium-protoporphyrin IX monomethyl ester cyclase